jgi:hypothetical protein
MWSHLDKENKITTTEQCRQSIVDLFTVNKRTINDYFDFLRVSKMLKPSSLKQRLTAVSHLFSYFQLRNDDIFKSTMSVNVDATFRYLGSLRRRMKKDEKRWLLETKNKEALIANRHLPKRGLISLRNVLNKVGPYYVVLSQLASKGVPLSHSEYEFVLDFTVASIYLLSPNARPKALDTMTLDMLEQLIGLGYVDSMFSKTVLSYGGQIIISHTELGRQILRIWMYLIRYQAIQRFGSCDEDEGSITAAFVNYYGRVVSRGFISRAFSRFLRLYGGLRTTTTDYRCVLETLVHTMGSAGDFTQHMNVAAMHCGQGHTNATSKLHYLKLTREESAKINSDNFDRHLLEKNPSGESWTWKEALFLIEVPINELEKSSVIVDSSESDNGSDDGDNDDGEDGDSEKEVEEGGATKCTDGIDNSQEDNATSNIGVARMMHGYSDWGILHPHYENTQGKRIPWSKDEVLVYEEFKKLNIVAHNRWQLFLEFVINRSEYRHIFHFNHVTDSARIHECGRAYERLKK